MYGHADGAEQDHHAGAGDSDDSADAVNLAKCSGISTAGFTLVLAL